MGIESRLIAKIDATKDSCALVACGSRRFSRGPIVIFVPRLAAGSLHNWPIVCLFLTARNACVSPSTSNEVFLSVEQSFCRGESLGHPVYLPGVIWRTCWGDPAHARHASTG